MESHGHKGHGSFLAYSLGIRTLMIAMKVKGISLFSGGLDSILAVKVIQEQGIEVVALSFTTPFFSAKKAVAAARNIDLPLLIDDITDEHLVMLRSPRYGYGRNMNPCIDCHALMLKKAGEKMVELGADFIFTGEVLGQRPMSQTKQSLHIVAKNSGFEPFVVRPLSAKLLPITMVEEKGLVDRARLLDIQGRGRKRQMALACRYGITEYSNPAGGCLLTDPTFSKRLRDLFEHTARPAVRDIELLKYGRHFRFSEATKVIVGRNRKENEMLLKFYAPTDIVITTRDYPGPVTLIPAGCDQAFLARAASLCVSYSDAPKDGSVTTVCRMGEAQFILTAKACPREETERWMV